MYCSKGLKLTILELGFMLGRIVCLDSSEEVLSAAAWCHMLYAHVDPLLEYPMADLQAMNDDDK